MFDPEWVRESDEAIIWQPWLLPVHIQVVFRGTYDDGEPYLVVKAWMRVLEVGSADIGIDLADLGNTHFQLGSFFWEPDGVLMAGCGVSLNRDSRTTLTLLHTAVLTMATCAHELLSQTDQADELPPLAADEESLGRRDTTDELLTIYAGSECELPGQERLGQVWPNARPLLKEMMLSHGYEEGFTDASVDFYVRDGVQMGVGWDGDSGKYGVGLDVLAIVAPPLQEMPGLSEFVNDGNMLLATQSPSHVCNLHWVDSGQGYISLHCKSFLGWGLLGQYSTDPEQLAIACFNALGQIETGAKNLVVDPSSPSEGDGPR